MTQVYLGVGSNLGDRGGYLRFAVGRLGEAEGVGSVRLSPVFETDPVGPIEQGPFLNAVIGLETTLSARELLALSQRIQADAGREPGGKRVHWGPRELDLDLLLFGNTVIDEPGLTVPHPRMHERVFVLEPLAELEPGAFHPVLKQTAAEMLSGLLASPGGAGRGRRFS